MVGSDFNLNKDFLPCPICGRKPKMKTYGVNYMNVFCKPFLRRTHCDVWTPYSQPSALKDKAKICWNSKVRGYLIAKAKVGKRHKHSKKGFLKSEIRLL